MVYGHVGRSLAGAGGRRDRPMRPCSAVETIVMDLLCARIADDHQVLARMKRPAVLIAVEVVVAGEAGGCLAPRQPAIGIGGVPIQDEGNTSFDDRSLVDRDGNEIAADRD